MTKTERQRRVTSAKALHPALFKRIRKQCVYASPSVDLDEHAAGIVLTVARARA